MGLKLTYIFETYVSPLYSPLPATFMLNCMIYGQFFLKVFKRAPLSSIIDKVIFFCNLY